MNLSQSGHFAEQLPGPQPSCYTNLDIPASRCQAKYDFKWLWYIMGFVNVCCVIKYSVESKDKTSS